MSFILKADKITNGSITRLIENVFLAESKGNKYKASLKELTEIHKAIIQYDNSSTFGELACEIKYPPNELNRKTYCKEDHKADSESEILVSDTELLKQMQVKLYERPGFILYDGIYAKAGGRFRSLYKGSGTRILWLDSGEIKVINLYLEVNSDGVSYQHFELDSLNIFNDKANEEDYDDIYMYVGEEEFPTLDFKYSDYSNVYFWVEKLTKINMQFNRSYALEYLIYPADVQRICKFSVELKSELWESCLDLAERIVIGKADKIHLDLFKFYVNFLNMVRVEPDINKINSFFGKLFDSMEDINKINLKRIMDILNNEDFGKQPIDVTSLPENLDNISSGKKDAYKYHEYIFKSLEYIFYPNLRTGCTEQDINDGRMRVDIVFDNHAKDGFFKQLNDLHKIKCPYIFVECKNYAKDVANPELDQICGRLNEKRGVFGFLVCRNVKDKDKLIQRCKDIVNEKKLYVIVLCDDDVKNLILFKKNGEQNKIDDYLNFKLRQLLL